MGIAIITEAKRNLLAHQGGKNLVVLNATPAKRDNLNEAGVLLPLRLHPFPNLSGRFWIGILPSSQFHFTTNQKRIADLAKTYRLPAIHSRGIGSTEAAYGADQGEPYDRRSNCINARPVYAAASLILAESTSRIRKIENTPHTAKVSSNENYKE